MKTNPYGGKPGSGISIAPYFRPTPSVRNASNYFPIGEKLGPDEMRISFVGSCPFPPRRDQAGTSIMVELGNGERFFFDLGSGCLRNIIAMQVPIMAVNDIFLTHLHVDHFADLPYLYCFAPWLLRWKPLRVHGPSGRTPKDGTAAMIEGMKQMTHWHTKSFRTSPVGDGYEVEVNEFDWKDENGLCYDKNGVQVRHWPRSHVMDGASACRLDWNGLSFVWTGDGRPDELTLKYSKGEEGDCTDPHCRHDHHTHDHANTFSTWSYESDEPLLLETLRAVMNKLPSQIYCAKGAIYTSDAPARRAVLHVVGKRADISLQDEWGERTPRTQIVVIGAAGQIDPVALRRQIDTAKRSNSRRT